MSQQQEKQEPSIDLLIESIAGFASLKQHKAEKQEV